MSKLLLLLSAVYTMGIYSFDLTGTDGNTIHLNDFKGKKILFVTIATSGSKLQQCGQLESLYQKYKDSLVVIAVPSNSFGNETRTDAQIDSFLQDHFHIHYLVATKTNVAGTQQSPLFAWLTHEEQNGVMSNTLRGDFYKFLIDESGNLRGVFSPSVDPMSEELQSALHN
jgi:glutathione peroxidase